jgi:hypothetical protein
LEQNLLIVVGYLNCFFVITEDTEQILDSSSWYQQADILAVTGQIFLSQAVAIGGSGE